MSDSPTLLERLGAAGSAATSLRGGVPRWQRAVMVALVVAVVAGLALAVASQWSKLPDVEWRFAPAWLAAAIVALVAFQWVHAHLWVSMIHALGHPIPLLRGVSVWSITLLGRYVPTSVALAAGRMALAEREGVPKRVCAASLVYELAFTFAGASIVGAYFVVTLPDLEGNPGRWAVLAVPAVVLIVLDPAIFHRVADGVLRRLGRQTLPVSLSRPQVAWFTLLFAASFLVAGFGVYAFAEALHGVPAGDAGTAVGAYSVGFAASVLAFVLPGGLGAREGAMTAALSPILPVTVALAVAVAVRLAQMAVELGYAVIVPLLVRRT
ncbi:MAG TPA: lysylphosphatidylglycerol synthase domain-containing protein [Solirubrobacteraceae bacterium]|nr:lysylphosphatidylglycerol synthase domain-containing protein [Solirubrobacteraceae bacterium]